jgi:hypothetical protein
MAGGFDAQAASLPEEMAPGTHWMGGWVGPRANPDEMEKKFLSYRDSNNHLCGLVVRVPGYRSRGPGSIPRFSEK